MKKMNKFVTAILMLCMVFALCACGSSNGGNTENNSENKNSQESQSVESQNSEESEESEDDGTVHYTIKVTDEGGNPIAGAMVQMCSESCFPGSTNEEGVAEFDRPEDEYKVSFLYLPEGYEYVDENETFYFEDGATELTIVLKAVQ